MRVDALGRCAASFGPISDGDSQRLAAFVLEHGRGERYRRWRRLF